MKEQEVHSEINLEFNSCLLNETKYTHGVIMHCLTSDCNEEKKTYLRVNENIKCKFSGFSVW